MNLTKKELEALVAKYRAEAEKQYRNYQETGITRYNTARQKAENLADAMQMALDAKDDHEYMLYLQTTIHNWAIRALKEDPALFHEVKTLAVAQGLMKEDSL